MITKSSTPPETSACLRIILKPQQNPFCWGFLSEYAAAPDHSYDHTLVVNYAGLDPSRLGEAVHLLEQIFTE